MMGVTAPDQDVSSTQKYFTPPFGKGTPTHSPGGAFMFPPPDLAHTVHFSPSPPQVHPHPHPSIKVQCHLFQESSRNVPSYEQSEGIGFIAF